MQGKAVQKERKKREETRLNKSDGFAQKYRNRSRLLCTALVGLKRHAMDGEVTIAHSGQTDTDTDSIDKRTESDVFSDIRMQLGLASKPHVRHIY